TGYRAKVGLQVGILGIQSPRSDVQLPAPRGDGTAPVEKLAPSLDAARPKDVRLSARAYEDAVGIDSIR
ncbi:hypothetical protein, partial [Sphingomonas sp.]|uniref:hypothetical protein n=1 Tax=Sphingomonas sp. TaxID=28214 RepID=UPI002D1FB5D2